MRKRTWRAAERGPGYGMGKVLLTAEIIGEGANDGREVFVEMSPARAREIAAYLVEFAATVEEMDRPPARVVHYIHSSKGTAPCFDGVRQGSDLQRFAAEHREIGNRVRHALSRENEGDRFERFLAVKSRVEPNPKSYVDTRRI